MRKLPSLPWLLALAGLVLVVWTLRPRADSGSAPAPPSLAPEASAAEGPPATQGPGSGLVRPAIAAPGPSPETAAAGPPTRQAEPGPAPLLIHGLLFERAPAEDPAGPPVPVPGLEIEVHGRSFTDNFLTSTLSAAGGRFELLLAREPRRETVWLRVAGDERFRDLRQAVLLPEEGPVEVQLGRAPRGEMEGIVTDPAGLPLPGVQLRFERDGGQPAHSDLGGRFPLPGTDSHPAVRAGLPGHAALRSRGARRAPRGGWRPMELVMAPAGTLRLHFVDRAGTAVPGVRTELGIDREERARWRDAFGRRKSRASGEDGLLVIPDVPIGEPLELVLLAEGSRIEAQGVRDGELCLGADAGQPLLVPDSGGLDLRVVLEGRLTITGRVLAAGGAPHDAAQVKLWDPRRETGAGGLPLEASTDGEGFFSFTVRRGAEAGPLVVSAWAGSRPSEPIGMGTGTVVFEGENPGPKDDFQLAWRAIDPARAREGLLEVELQLAPPLTIAGSVSAGEQSARGFNVRAVLPEGDLLGQVSPWTAAAGGRRCVTRVSKTGEFELGPLPAGAHDVIVQRQLGAPGEPSHRFRGLRAGTQDNLLILPTELPVRVLLHPERSTDEVVGLEVAFARWYPLGAKGDARGTNRPDADRLSGWPGDRWRAAGRESREDRADGTLITRGFLLDRPTAELPPTTEGWYVLGVRPVGSEGHEWALVSCGPIRLDGGLHEISYALVPTGSLELRLEREGDNILAAALYDDEGGAIPLRSGAGSVRFARELRTRDRARFDALPVGRHTLRIGTERELSFGRARHEEPVLIEAGETTRARIRLP